MFGWRRRRGASRSGDAQQLVKETSAYLLGHSPEVFWHQGERVPAWAWLNPLAHQEPSAVDAFARTARRAHYPTGSWQWAMGRLAEAMCELAHEDEGVIRELQGECLIPLELLLLAPVTPRVRTPRELLGLALSRVRAHQTSRHED